MGGAPPFFPRFKTFCLPKTFPVLKGLFRASPCFKNFFSSQRFISVKFSMLDLDFHHISFSNYIVAADGTKKAFRAGGSIPAGFEERFPVYHFGPDE